MELILIVGGVAAFGLYRFNKWRLQQPSTPGYSRDTRARVKQVERQLNPATERLNQLEHQVQDLKYRLAEAQSRTTSAEQHLALLEQRVSTLESTSY